MARTRNRLDRTPFQTAVTDLSHDGRGVARRDGEGGKVTFISGALPGELVRAEPTARSRHFDEAKTVGCWRHRRSGSPALPALWRLRRLCVAASGGIAADRGQTARTDG